MLLFYATSSALVGLPKSDKERRQKDCADRGGKGLESHRFFNVAPPPPHTDMNPILWNWRRRSPRMTTAASRSSSSTTSLRCCTNLVKVRGKSCYFYAQRIPCPYIALDQVVSTWPGPRSMREWHRTPRVHTVQGYLSRMNMFLSKPLSLIPVPPTVGGPIGHVCPWWQNLVSPGGCVFGTRHFNSQL